MCSPSVAKKRSAAPAAASGESGIGLDHVIAVLDGLWAERHEERYRVAPLLRRAQALGGGATFGLAGS